MVMILCSMEVSLSMDVKTFWDAVLRQDADAIREYFHPPG